MSPLPSPHSHPSRCCSCPRCTLCSRTSRWRSVSLSRSDEDLTLLRKSNASPNLHHHNLRHSQPHWHQHQQQLQQQQQQMLQQRRQKQQQYNQNQMLTLQSCSPSILQQQFLKSPSLKKPTSPLHLQSINNARSENEQPSVQLKNATPSPPKHVRPFSSYMPLNAAAARRRRSLSMSSNLVSASYRNLSPVPLQPSKSDTGLPLSPTSTFCSSSCSSAACLLSSSSMDVPVQRDGKRKSSKQVASTTSCSGSFSHSSKTARISGNIDSCNDDIKINSSSRHFVASGGMPCGCCCSTCCVRRRRHRLAQSEENFEKEMEDNSPSLSSYIASIKNAATSGAQSSRAIADALQARLLPLIPNSFASAFWTTRKLPLYIFTQLPRYLQDNEFIHSGYRASYSYREAWRSIFYLHNETGNIWTHLVGLFVFIALAIAVPSLLYKYTAADIAVFLIFILSACKCFAFSTLFHTHFCNSHRAFVCFGCLDYAGISLLICGSAVVATYYLHYCQPALRTSYLVVQGTTSAVGIVGPFFSVWSTPGFRPGRTAIYVFSALVSALPIVHFLYRDGIPPTLTFWAFYGWFIMGAIYIGGAVIYAFKIPERWLPGKLDLVGHSHQIWHICVVMAALVHFVSALDLFLWRKRTTCSAA